MSNNDSSNEKENQWALHAAQQDMLMSEAEKQPLVGEKEVGFDSLKGFQQGVQALQQRRYTGLRRVRGDGNCFFRGFMFRLVEYLVETRNEEERKRLAKFMRDSLDYLQAAGYELVSVETFQELLVELFEDDIPRMKLAEVEKMFGKKEESEHVVWYSRVLCAAYMKLNADRFLPFIGEEYSSVEEYCSREVEPQGKECEQVHIIALAEVLGIRIIIEYISANLGDGGQVSLGPDDARIVIKLLYRPGHYDILYE